MNPYLMANFGEYDEDPNFGDALNKMLYGDEFGGAANQAFRGLPLALQQRAANIAKAQGGRGQLARPQQRIPLAVLTEHARGDDIIYGLDSGAAAIAAGVTVSISTTPQKRHIPKRIALTEAVANNFILSDLRVGVEPVLATTGNISLAIFVQNSTSPPFRAVLCEVGMDVTVVVTNVDAAAHRFTATVIGTYVPPTVR
jgi:hypothetical protein